MRLTLAPKSQRAFLITALPIEQGIVNLPGSPSLGGNSLLNTALHSEVSWIFLQSLRFSFMR